MQISKSLALWLGIGIAVIAILGVIQLVRVNEPQPSRETPPTPVYTRGTVIEAPVLIPAEGFLDYRINLNRRGRLKGTLESESRTPKVEVLVLTEENFNAYREGREFDTVVRTGRLSSIVVNRELEPGIFYLVFDNRTPGSKPVEMAASFAVE